MQTSSTTMPTAKLHIVTALACEARCLIDYYHLKKINTAGNFDCYVSADQQIHLIKAGVGAIAAAAATAYVFAITQQQTHSTFLNLGIAASKSYPIGSAYLINKIIDQSTGKTFYPQPLATTTLPQSTLISYTAPQQVIAAEVLADMEASGFFQTAIRLVSKEQLQVIKIVSDHGVAPQQSLAKSYVDKLMRQQLVAINDVITALLQQSQHEASLTLALPTEAFLQRWHFSHYQQQQLQELLRRWQALPTEHPAIHYCQQAHDASTVLRLLRHELNQLPYTW